MPSEIYRGFELQCDVLRLPGRRGNDVWAGNICRRNLATGESAEYCIEVRALTCKSARRVCRAVAREQVDATVDRGYRDGERATRNTALLRHDANSRMGIQYVVDVVVAQGGGYRGIIDFSRESDRAVQSLGCLYLRVAFQTVRGAQSCASNH